MELDAKKVNEIFMDCLFGEQPKEGTEFIPVMGITNKFGLNPVKIEKHAEEIKGLLDCLNDNFKEKVGGGYSFIAIPFDKNENQWGEHRNAEELMVLGLASGYMKYNYEDRSLWRALPYGVPYVTIFENRQEVKKQLVA